LRRARKAGIEVAVFERDRSQHFRNTGLPHPASTPTAAERSGACVPENLFELAMATSRKPLGGRFVMCDPQLNERFARSIPQPDRDPALPDRTLHKRESPHLARDTACRPPDVVHFGKPLVRIEQRMIGLRALWRRDLRQWRLAGRRRWRSFRCAPVAACRTPSSSDPSTKGIYGRTLLPTNMESLAPRVLAQGISIVRDAGGTTVMLGAFRKHEAFDKANRKTGVQRPSNGCARLPHVDP